MIAMAKSKMSQKIDFTELQNTLYDRLTALIGDMSTGIKVEAYVFGDECHEALGRNLYVEFTESLTSYDIDLLVKEFKVGLVVPYWGTENQFVISERD